MDEELPYDPETALQTDDENFEGNFEVSHELYGNFEVSRETCNEDDNFEGNRMDGAEARVAAAWVPQLYPGLDQSVPEQPTAWTPQLFPDSVVLSAQAQEFYPDAPPAAREAFFPDAPPAAREAFFPDALAAPVAVREAVTVAPVSSLAPIGSDRLAPCGSVAPRTSDLLGGGADFGFSFGGGSQPSRAIYEIWERPAALVGSPALGSRGTGATPSPAAIASMALRARPPPYKAPRVGKAAHKEVAAVEDGSQSDDGSNAGPCRPGKGAKGKGSSKSCDNESRLQQQTRQQRAAAFRREREQFRAAAKEAADESKEVDVEAQ